MNDRAWVEINLENLNHNIKVLNAALPEGCQLMAVVKANGYGHGAEGIATQLEKLGVTAFAVATIDEGIALRQAGVRSEILILGFTDPHRACELSDFDLTQTIVGYEHALEVLKNARIEDADFHTLRHTFTTRCIESGMDILMVAKTLGHANVAMTLNQYSHLLPKHMKASMEKLETNYY